MNKIKGKNWEEFWDYINIELYALVKQVKKNKKQFK